MFLNGKRLSRGRQDLMPSQFNFPPTPFTRHSSFKWTLLMPANQQQTATFEHYLSPITNCIDPQLYNRQLKATSVVHANHCHHRLRLQSAESIPNFTANTEQNLQYNNLKLSDIAISVIIDIRPSIKIRRLCHHITAITTVATTFIWLLQPPTPPRIIQLLHLPITHRHRRSTAYKI